MEFTVSPKYQMQLVSKIEKAISDEYFSDKNIRFYIEKWYESDDFNWENFQIKNHKLTGEIDLSATLHSMNGDTLIKIAIDMGVETPDFLPSIPTFRNEIKSDYGNAHATFEKAFKQIESHPDMAIGLVNSVLESIIKEIFKDDRIQTKSKTGKTLYDLTCDLLKEFQMFPESEMPVEMKTIGSSLLSINQSIEKLRSEKTNVHGKTSEDYVIQDSLYTYFIVNTVTTVGLFLMSYYKIKFPKIKVQEIMPDELPF